MTDVVFISVNSPHDKYGAALLLAYLAFPYELNKRVKFIKYVNAQLMRSDYPLYSTERQMIQEIEGNQELFSIPTKKIDQFLGIGKKSAGYRLNMRIRVAHAMWLKVNSNSDPASQYSLSEIAKKVAAFNTPEFPAFSGGESFTKQGIWKAKPVMHLTMAIYYHLYRKEMLDVSIVGLVNQSDLWLDDSLQLAEKIRLEFSQWFPKIEKVPSISFLPKHL
jgi:hypothetical protein